MNVFNVIVVNESLGRSMTSCMYSTYPVRFMELKQVEYSNILTIYYLGFGGGLLSCDRVNIDCVVGDNANLCIKTPGSSKVYKSDSNKPLITHSYDYHVNNNSFLGLLIDPIVCYKDSQYSQIQTFHLNSSSNLIAIDWFTCGRKDCGEFWEMRQIKSLTKIYLNNNLIFNDNIDVHNTKYSSISTKLGHCSVFGTLIIYGNQMKRLITRLKYTTTRESFSDLSNVRHSIKSPLISVSTLDSDLAIVRFQGDSLELLYTIIADVLSPLNENYTDIKPFHDRTNESLLSNDFNNKLRKFDQQDTD